MPLLVAVAATAASAGAAPLTLSSGDTTLTVEPATLALSLSVGGSEWLAGGAFTRAGGARQEAEQLLAHAAPTKTAGADVLGAWSGYNFSWTHANASAPTWLTSVRAYASGGRIVFRQVRARAAGGSAMIVTRLP
jgi:hypothetical protein